MASLMMVRAEARFHGLVQGVYFRAYTVDFAKRRGVTGWVRNLSDGSVGAVFEGERADIEEVVRQLREEHPAARVDSVEIKWSEPLGQFDDFAIRR
jgi:acylphosphatase